MSSGFFRSAICAALALGLGLPWTSAQALEIDIDDVAPERVARQIAHARGMLPLSGAPDPARLGERLAAKGLSKGDAIFLRIFKASSELELWMQKGPAFVLLDTYPICFWTGSLGPKLREGDKQSPEGFYSVASRQMRRATSRWRRAFDLGFPNAFDQSNKRTGSHILVHGGCSSTGCFAMTDAVQNEIYALAHAALKNGQARFHVHVFPFRMTEAAMAAHADSPWAPFWRDLQVGYEAFEQSRVPPRVALCGQRYRVFEGGGGSDRPPECRDGEPPSGEVLAVGVESRSRPAVGRHEVRRLSRVNAERATREAPLEDEQSLAPNGLGHRIDKGAPRIVSSGG